MCAHLLLLPPFDSIYTVSSLQIVRSARGRLVAWVPCHDGTCPDTTAPARASLSPEEKAAAGKLELVEADWPDRYSRSAWRARTPTHPAHSHQYNTDPWGSSVKTHSPLACSELHGSHSVACLCKCFSLQCAVHSCALLTGSWHNNRQWAGWYDLTDVERSGALTLGAHSRPHIAVPPRPLVFSCPPCVESAGGAGV